MQDKETERERERERYHLCSMKCRERDRGGEIKSERKKRKREHLCNMKISSNRHTPHFRSIDAPAMQREMWRKLQPQDWCNTT